MAHYALQKLHILPSVFTKMDQREKALVIASIEKRVEDEKKEQDKTKRTKKGRKRRKKR